MWRAGITKLDSSTESKNFPDKEKAELWVLEKAEKEGIKYSLIVNKENTKERYPMNWRKDKK